jgi:ribosome-binding protein aMBF1 (putative translation factor)
MMGPKKGKKKVLSRAGQRLEHVKQHHPHRYRAIKNPTARARLGANVTDLRLKKGLNHEQLASRAKIGAHALRKIEQAHPSSNPSMEVLERVSKALGVDIQDLFRFVTLAETVVR